MDEEGARFDSGFDDGGPFRVTPEAGGVSLESALRDYGPAAIDDLIPRLRAIARSLDAAHAAGYVHGALHPSKVIVHDDATSLIAGTVAITPYAAPEMADGSAAPASDQYALAAIAYEWLFGRPVDLRPDRAIDIPLMPGVDRIALAKAFTRALASNPRARFASCTEFCDAINHAVIPGLPLLAADAEDDLDDPVGPFMPEQPVDVEEKPVALAQQMGGTLADDEALFAPTATDVSDVNMVSEEPLLTATSFEAEHDEPLLAQDTRGLEGIDPVVSKVDAAVAPVSPSASGSSARSHDAQRFGGLALILATLVGAVFGFAAGYMARPRALQSGPPQEIASVASGASGASGTPSASGAPVASGATENRTAPTATQTRPAAQAPPAVQAPVNAGRLLVRSTPSGARVSVDGVEKGVTPLALRDLSNGTVNVTVARDGYIPETRNVAISRARPARSLDVRLAPQAAAAAPRPSTPATLGRPASTTGSLVVDSRPSGASVSINGRPRGTTPLTIDDLAPGEYRVEMSLTGYRNLVTTVRVVAGERVRAAASLTALEQQ